VKRSKIIRLVLLGGVSAGSLTACNPSGSNSISADAYYTNNYHIAGVGYYHAPFRAWYSMPFNHYDVGTKRYFFGGTWATAPYQSITNISAPTSAAAQQARSLASVSRGGFGRTSHSHWTHS
jgi:hypothetical protein